MQLKQFKIKDFFSHFKPWHILSMLLAILAGLGLAIYIYQTQDTEMRDNLTTYAKTIEQSIDWSALNNALEQGPAPDKINPDDLNEIKMQMRNACKSNPKCHFIYLVYGDDNGQAQQVKFLLDASNQPASEISQMGEVFYDASEMLRSAIKTQKSYVEGPVTDHWGTWVSSLVPVTSTLNAKHFVMLGVDVGIAGWKQHAMQKVAVPIAVALLFIAMLLGLIYQNANKEWRLKQLTSSSSELGQMANIDLMTGLPNRNILGDRMIQAFKIADRAENLVAVLYVDLDYFKEINDGYGHAVGDQLLKRAADRLASLIRVEDTIARVGGDEFIILLTDIATNTQAMVVAQKIVDGMKVPFNVVDKAFQFGASVGVAIYPTQERRPNHLIHFADIAKYYAKRQGRGRYSLYDKTMEKMFYKNE
jgi:diguanylate cyclase (GGDEF)-like protein